MTPRFLDVGDTAVTVEFGDAIDPVLLTRVDSLDQAIRAAMAAGRLPGVVETVPTFRSLTVVYDPLLTSRAEIDPVLRAGLSGTAVATLRTGRQWRVPVCYGGEFGPDLEAMASSIGIASEEVARLHAATTYRVYMLGFLPGFPFMGDLPEAMALPRRTEPRVRVPAGSVATAGRLTAIYPWESPGGWHLLGRCPLPLFSPHWPGAALFLPGDRVRFYAIDTAEFVRIEQRWVGSDKAPVEYLEAEAA